MKKIQLKFTSVSDAIETINRLTQESPDEFFVVDGSGTKEADPRTYIGLIYAVSEFDEIYLVNKTNDGVFPEFIK